MKLLTKMKDGGPKSSVTGYFLVEIKSLFTLVLLCFNGKSREAYHTHAFHSLAWVLRGELLEEMIDGRTFTHKPSVFPIFVGRRDFHRVSSVPEKTWVLNIRGPWSKYWNEFENSKITKLGHGREITVDN